MPRYRRTEYVNWSEYNEDERDRVSALYGGIDEDVRQVFFNLPQETLDRILADYMQKHGKSACTYAKKAYGNWKTGNVQMSGRVSERLLAIVPRYLEFSVKYDLLEKLCRRREGTRLTVEITGEMTAREALATALRAVESVRSNKLPDNITKRLHWLADNEGRVAQDLLTHVFAREYESIVRALQAGLQRLLALSSELKGRPVEMQAERDHLARRDSSDRHEFQNGEKENGRRTARRKARSSTESSGRPCADTEPAEST